MNKKAYIHIGPPKTGSTSIQNILFSNQGELNKLGVLYPNAGILQRGEGYYLNRGQGHRRFEQGPDVCHQLLPWELKGTLENYSKNSWSDLLQEIEKSDCDKIILSAEGFFGLNEGQINIVFEHLKKYDPKIIAYFRHPYKRSKSLYNQMVKRGKVSESFESFVKGYYLKSAQRDFKKIVTWIQIFGETKVVIKPFDKLTKSNSLSFDFLSEIGIDVSNMNTTEQRLNSSLNPISIKALRILNFIQPKNKKGPLLSFFFNPLRFKTFSLLRKPFFGKTKYTHKKDDELSRELISSLGKEYLNLVKKHFKKEDWNLYLK